MKTVKNSFGTMIEEKKPIRGAGTLSTTQKKAAFLLIFKKKQCNISKACDAVPIDRKTYYNWMDSDEVFKARIEAILEGLLDWAESQLRKNMKDGNVIATIFFLKTQGKKRGYIEKQQHEHSGSVMFEASEKFLPKPKEEPKP